MESTRLQTTGLPSKVCLLATCWLFAILVAPPTARAQQVTAVADQRVSLLLDVLRTRQVLNQADYDRIVNSPRALEALLEVLAKNGVLTQEQSAHILQGSQPDASFSSSFSSNGIRKASSAEPSRLTTAGVSSSPEVNPQQITAEMRPRPVPPSPANPLPLTPRQPTGPLTFALASGVTVGVDGFMKTNLIQASNESSGDDFPVFARVVGTGPETANSTGTTNKPPSLRLHSRSMRTGMSFWAPDVHHKFDISGRFELDWAGNFSISTNNNFGAVRSPASRMRLAYVRLDTHIGKLPVFLKIGQDFTIFTSSTLPSGIEPNGVYVFQGVIWERLPGIVAGWRHDLGGAWDWKFQPEFGLMLPLGGEGVFANPFSPLAGSGLGSVFTGNPTAPGQTGLGIGQREGTNSNRPHTEGRLVLQFSPFRDHPEVVPSWFIFSFQASDRARIFAPPFTQAKPEHLQNFILKNQSIGYSAEFRIATPWSTWLGKYYRGTDLRQFFGGLAQDVFYDGPDPLGLSTILPRMRGVRSQGGFIQWQIPLSVLFRAERPALQGFSANLYYGQDSAFARDARRTGQRKAQHGVMADIIYQYNRYLQFGVEVNWIEMLYTSRQGGSLLGGLVGTDLRKEFSATFMF
ncbi:MAG: hypothetical protein HY647_03115 [Acidobacteria bacterium]|nr:hypothetical protein [Acidobacteriota bacterium]